MTPTDEQLAKFIKLTKANIGTMEVQRLRMLSWGYSTEELNTAIRESKNFLREVER